MATDIDFSINPKQQLFCKEVLRASAGASPYRYFCFGGAIRGGKTWALLGTLIFLCNIYPKSKWIVYRADWPSLQDTTIPSLEKIIGGLSQWKWSRTPNNFFVQHENGSRIYFYGENAAQDPELNTMLGMECNGIVLEQAEELTENLFNMAMTRIGSWHTEKESKPIIMLTLNPSHNWVKKKFYDPWVKGELKAPYMFIQALPQDNPTNTDEQWSAWNSTDVRYRKQFIEGDWTDLSDKNTRWAYAFDRSKHVGDVVIREDLDLWLSFDFNINPISCSVMQHDEQSEHLYVIECIKLANSDIYKLCDYILEHYRGYYCMVTGDASGHNSSALVSDGLNYYKVIMDRLQINRNQLVVPRSNPPLAENQHVVNSLLTNYKITIDQRKAGALIWDCENVKMNPDGTILKLNRKDPSQQADAIDTLRYALNVWLRRKVREFSKS